MWERKDGFLYTYDWGVEMIEDMMNEGRHLEKDIVRREKDLEIQWKDSTTREAKYNNRHKESMKKSDGPNYLGDSKLYKIGVDNGIREL